MILIKKGQTNNISVSVSLNSTLNSPYYLFRFTQIMSKDTITFIPKVILLSDRYDEFQFIEDSSVDLSADPPKVYFRYEGQYWVEIYENCDGSLDVDQSRLVWDGRAEVIDDCPPDQYWQFTSDNENNANFIFLQEDEYCPITPSPTPTQTSTPLPSSSPTETPTSTPTQTHTPTSTPTPTLLTEFCIDNGFDYATEGTVISTGNTMYVYGGMEFYDNNDINKIVRLNKTTGQLINDFVPSFPDSIEYVYSVEEASNGDLYVVGNFTTYDGSTQNRIVKIDNTGREITSFNVGTGFNAQVNGIILDEANNRLFCWGSFTSYDGTTSNRLAMLDATTGQIDPLWLSGFGTGFNNQVYSAFLDGSGGLYVCGAFTQFQGATNNRYIKLFAYAGTKDTSFVNTTGASSSVYNILSDGTDIFIMGAFTTVRGVSSPRVCKIDTSGNVDGTYAGTGANQSILASAIDGLGRLIIASTSSLTWQGTLVNGLARLNVDGTLDTTFVSNNGASFSLGYNHSVPSQKDAIIVETPYIYITGDFGAFDGVSLNNYVRIRETGVLDTINTCNYPPVTPTATNSPTPSITASPTSTPTQTPTVTPTMTPTNTSTPTQTPTNTSSNTPTPSITASQTATSTPTQTPSETPTNTPTQTPTNTPTQTQTQTPTNTPSQTQTQTPTNTPTQTQTQTPTNTPTNTVTSTPTQTPSPTPTKIAVCPEQFEMTVVSGQAGLIGTHTRQYSASTQNFNYAYLDITSGETFNFGTAPDGKNYPLFQYYDAVNGIYSTTVHIYSTLPNLQNKYWVWSGTSNILESGYRDNVAETISTGFTEVNGVQFPESGCLTFSPGYTTFCFNYTEICPSPTPTNTPTQTSTSTQTPTPTPTPTIPLSGTTEANAYLEAVVQAGGTVDATMSAATRTLFTSIVSNGLWDKLHKMYPYLGGVAASHSLEGKTAVSEISWNGGITHDANGVQGNGSNGYGDTGINANTLLTPTTSTSAGIYVNANGAGNNIYDLGVEHPSIALQDMFNLTAKRSAGTGNNTLFDAGTYPNGRVETTSQADALGMTIGTIRAAADRELYRNGSSIATSTTSHTPAYASRNIFVLAQNSTSGANYYSNHRHAFCFIGQGLDDTDVSNLSTIINTYQTALGRNTY